MKRWFINRLQSQESLITLDGTRIETSTSKSLSRPKSLTRHTKKPNQLPEIELIMGACSVKYQLHPSDLMCVAITKRDWNKMQEHQIIENALA